MTIDTCPLCGKVPNVWVPDDSIRMDGHIACYDCDLVMDIPHSHGKDQENYEAAVAKWNRRNSVRILGPTDLIDPEDWCRPLHIVSMSGGHSDFYSFKSCYSGTPENNAKWVKVKYVVGKPWFGKPTGEYNSRDALIPMEFVHGEVPKEHQLDMKGYSRLDD